MSTGCPPDPIGGAIQRLSSVLSAEDDQHWLEMLASPGVEKKPQQLVKLIGQLVAASHIAEALAVNQLILLGDPENPTAWTRRAHLAHRSSDWPQALTAYERALGLAAPERREGLAVAWARCLIEARLIGEAVTRIQALAEDFPDCDSLPRLLSQALLMGGKFAELISLAERHRHRRSSQVAALFFNEISAYARLGKRDPVKGLIEVQIAQGDSPEQLRHCLTALDHLAPPERKPLYSEIRQRAESLLTADATSAEDRFMLEILMLRFAVFEHDTESFSRRYKRLTASNDAAKVPAILAALHARLNDDSPKQKVFGIGLSKTATSSLDRALAILGYASAHFLNPATSITLSLEDSRYFDAMTDTPVSWEFERYHARFPDARFVYTVRDPVRWKQSLLRHFAIDRGENHWPALRASNARMRSNLPEIEGNLYFRHESPEAAWEHHHQRVMEFFGGERASQLLILDIEAGDGWETICGFLGEPVPAVPFPHENPRRVV